MSLTRTLVLLSSVALSTATAVVPRGDLAALPIPPAAVQSALSSKVPLAKAIEAAEKDTGGRAHDATFGADGVVTVNTYSATQHFVVQVDGTSGTVKAKEDLTLPLPGVPPVGELVQLPSGLLYYDLVVGTGDQPAGPTSTVKVHYTGYLNDGRKFDSSVDRGQPWQTKLNRVVKGWTEGIGSMKVGGKRKLIVPPALGYGDQGNGNVIPPRAALVFDVELIEVVK